MALGGLWDLLVDGICRPPRDDQYGIEDLVGGSRCVFQVANAVGIREDVIVLNRRGLKLACSHYKPTGVKGKDGKLPCVVYSHCNSGSRRDAEEAVFLLIPLGISVFTVDFAGSGVSDGEWVTLGASESEDLEAVLAYLRASGKASTIGLWGRSMGAVTALLYAHKDPAIAAMVLDSPFCRLTDLITEVAQQLKLPIPRYFLKRAVGAMRRSVQKRAGFDINTVSPLDLVHKCKIPALFGHGTEDSHIGIEHSRKLHNAYAGERSIIFFGGNHLTIRPEFFYITVAVFFHRNMQVQQLLEGAPPLDLETLEQLASVVTALLESRATADDVEDESMLSGFSVTDRGTSVRSGSPVRARSSTTSMMADDASLKRRAAEFDRDMTISNHSTMPPSGSAVSSPTYSNTTEQMAPSTPGSNDANMRATAAQPFKQKPTHVMDVLRGRLNSAGTSPPSKQPTLKRSSTGGAPSAATPGQEGGRPMDMEEPTGGTWSDSGSEGPPSPREDPDKNIEWFLHSRTVTENGLVVCEYTGPHNNRKYRWRVVAKEEDEAKSVARSSAELSSQHSSSNPQLQQSYTDPTRTSSDGRPSSAGRPSPRPSPSPIHTPSHTPSSGGFTPSALDAIAERSHKSMEPSHPANGEVWKVQSRVPTAEGTVLCEYCGDPPNRRYRWRVLGPEDEGNPVLLAGAPNAPQPHPKAPSAPKPLDPTNPVESIAALAGDDNDSQPQPEKEGEWKVMNKVTTAEGLLVCEYKGGFLNREYRWRIISPEAEGLLTAASTSDGTSSPRSSLDGGGIRVSQEYAVLRSQQPAVTPKAHHRMSAPRNIMSVAPDRMDSSTMSSDANIVSIANIHEFNDGPRRSSFSTESNVTNFSSSDGDDNDQVVLTSVLEATGVGQKENGVGEDVLQLYHSLDASTLMSLVQLHSGQGIDEFDIDPLLPTIKEKDEELDRDQSSPSARADDSSSKPGSASRSSSSSTTPLPKSTKDVYKLSPARPSTANSSQGNNGTATRSASSLTSPAGVKIPSSATFVAPTGRSSSEVRVSSGTIAAKDPNPTPSKPPPRPASPEMAGQVGCSPWTCSSGGGTKKKSSACVVQ